VPDSVRKVTGHFTFQESTVVHHANMNAMKGVKAPRHLHRELPGAAWTTQ